MSKIKHIIHLMLENRSFDNVLGWLYDDKNSPSHVISNSKQKEVAFYGLKEHTFYKRYDGSDEKYYVQKTASHCDVPDPDPHESYRYVTAQLYGQTAYPPDRDPYVGPPGDQPALNNGFLTNYATARWFWVGPVISREHAVQIMETYIPDQLPVLNGLARNFAVSDYWFSSVPTQTNCNRAFSLCGTSLGYTDNDKGKSFNARTVWNVLAEGGKSSQLDWMIYFQEKESG